MGNNIYNESCGDLKHAIYVSDVNISHMVKPRGYIKEEASEKEILYCEYIKRYKKEKAEYVSNITNDDTIHQDVKIRELCYLIEYVSPLTFYEFFNNKA
jgi:hypothetical protein